jgi:small subunit ribosomal protein S3
MGQKIHPLGLRIGITQKHRSDWFARVNDYPRLLLEDKVLRCYILNKYATTTISQLHISRLQTALNLETQEICDLVEISIHTATPGQIVDRDNPQKNIRELKRELEKLCQQTRTKSNLPKIRIILTIFQVKNAYSDASVLADFLIQQLEQRVPFRLALKKTLNRTRRAKLKGIKIQISGRLNGAEIARTEWVRKDRVPLQTLRADIDYSYKVAKTIYGILGIKVWTFKGEKK